MNEYQKPDLFAVYAGSGDDPRFAKTDETRGKTVMLQGIGEMMVWALGKDRPDGTDTFSLRQGKSSCRPYDNADQILFG